jgi:hypothetical protein
LVSRTLLSSCAALTVESFVVAVSPTAADATHMAVATKLTEKNIPS